MTANTPPAARGPGTLELMLRDIWRDVLKLDAVAADDDFFELGGDSFQAVAMLDAVEARIGTLLPAAVLLQCPTPATLARRLSQRPAARAASRVVTLNAHGSHTPVVAVHGTGDVLFYAPLSAALGPERPFYALQALPGPDGEGFGSIGELAASYIDDLKRVLPRGPYVLAGFCVGSTIAFEMARQMRRTGDVIEFVIMLDTAPRVPPGAWDIMVKAARRLRYYASRLAVHARQRTAPVTIRRWFGRSPRTRDGDTDTGAAAYSRTDHYTRLERAYRADRYPGDVVYVLTSGFARRPGAGVHARNARRIAGRRLSIIACDAQHNGQFHEPAVRVLAARLDAVLSKSKVG